MADIYLLNILYSTRVPAGLKTENGGVLPLAGNPFNFVLTGPTGFPSGDPMPNSFTAPPPYGGLKGLLVVNRLSVAFRGLGQALPNGDVWHSPWGFVKDRGKLANISSLYLAIVRIDMANSYGVGYWPRRRLQGGWMDSGLWAGRHLDQAAPWLDPAQLVERNGMLNSGDRRSPAGSMWIADQGTVEWIGAQGGDPSAAWEWLEANPLTPPPVEDWSPTGEPAWWTS